MGTTQERLGVTLKFKENKCVLDNFEEFGPQHKDLVFITEGIKLKAENSSGGQKFYFNFQDGEDCPKAVWATLWGKYKGEYIQIDFDDISLKKLKKMKKVITKMIKLKGK